MDDVHAYQRDRLLDAAVAAGKFREERRPHYAALYDADPVGTAHWIEQLAAASTLAAQPSLDHRALFPELSGQLVLGGLAPRVATPHVRPASAAEAETSPQLVEAWTDSLFPETAAARRTEAHVQAVGPSGYPRIMGDGSGDGTD